MARKPMKKNNRRERDDDVPDADDLGIRPVKDIERGRSWAFYGRSGSGKTTLSSTFPTPILLLDIKDQGTDSIADVKGIDVKDVDDFDDIDEIYWFLKKGAGKKKYKTVVFDTITQLQNLAILKVNPKADTKKLGDWGSMTMRQWGDVGAIMKEVITNFRDLGIEVVFLAQEKTINADEDDDDENALIPEVGPQASKGVASHLNACVSIIGHTFIRMKETTKEDKKGKKVKGKPVAQYCLRIGPNPIYTTKIRKPKDVTPPAFIVDPTYEDILDVITGE